jgi:hypothetical protein
MPNPIFTVLVRSCARLRRTQARKGLETWRTGEYHRQVSGQLAMAADVVNVANCSGVDAVTPEDNSALVHMSQGDLACEEEATASQVAQVMKGQE